MMSLTFGLFTQVSGSGPLGPLVFFFEMGRTSVLYTKKFSMLYNRISLDMIPKYIIYNLY